MAAHIYQRSLFAEHGFALWNNLWYSGRYSFVTYSLAVLPAGRAPRDQVLAVATIAVGTLAFSALVWRQWGADARWASRTFAPVWPLRALGRVPVHARRRVRTPRALCAAGRRTRGSSPLSSGSPPRPAPWRSFCSSSSWPAAGSHAVRARSYVLPAAAVGIAGLVEIALWRMFPSGGRYPFSKEEFLAAAAFCATGFAVTWRVERARPLRLIFTVYLAACVAACGDPLRARRERRRLRFVAIPLAVLALSLRQWRPLWVAVPVVALACSWNVTPLMASYAKARPTLGVRRLLAAGDRVPAQPPEPVLPRRGRRHGRSLGCRLSTRGRHPARPRLVPAGRLPAERPSLREAGPRAYGSWLREHGVKYVVLTARRSTTAREARPRSSPAERRARCACTARRRPRSIGFPRPGRSSPGRDARDPGPDGHHDPALADATRPVPGRRALLAVLEDPRRLRRAARGRDDGARESALGGRLVEVRRHGSSSARRAPGRCGVDLRHRDRVTG